MRLSKKTFKDGNIGLPLTKKDGENVQKNKGFNYELRRAKIKLMKLDEKEGGFLPALLAGLPILMGLIGATTGVANTVINKKNNDAKLEEEQRHNKEIEAIAKGGKQGESLYLNPYKYDGGCIKSAVDKSKLDTTGKKVLRTFLKNLSEHYKIESKEGGSLYLSPY